MFKNNVPKLCLRNGIKKIGLNKQDYHLRHPTNLIQKGT